MSLKSFVSKTLPLARRSILLNQVRHESVVSGPPTVRMPFYEKVIMGTIMCCSMLVIPAWVLVNIKHYNAKPAEE